MPRGVSGQPLSTGVTRPLDVSGTKHDTGTSPRVSPDEQQQTDTGSTYCYSTKAINHTRVQSHGSSHPRAKCILNLSLISDQYVSPPALVFGKLLMMFANWLGETPYSAQKNEIRSL